MGDGVYGINKVDVLELVGKGDEKNGERGEGDV